MTEETREILQHLDMLSDAAKAADKIGLFGKVSGLFKRNADGARDWRS